MNTYEKARAFMYRHARPLELALWQFHFENGSADNVLRALSFYQNEDGGFGHGLEADNWNPLSSPLTTQTATEILYAVDAPREHPLVQNTLRYLDSGAHFDAAHRQWLNCVPSNNDAPHAVWWTYREGADAFAYNPTAALAAFILRYAEKGSPVYEKGRAIAQEAIAWFLKRGVFGEKHITYCFLRLAQMGKGHDIPGLCALEAALHAQVRHNICPDLSKYGVEYVDRPTDLIDGPAHPCYPDIAETAQAECQFLVDSQRSDGSWPVPWTWCNEYREFAVAEDWWKGHIVLKHMLYLRHFGRG
ncbi:MAG: hypothetical protein PUC00_04195 [Clostridiales bacterium]|nr:hypothetical protein [Clostridiales bacterium]